MCSTGAHGAPHRALRSHPRFSLDACACPPRGKGIFVRDGDARRRHPARGRPMGRDSISRARFRHAQRAPRHRGGHAARSQDWTTRATFPNCDLVCAMRSLQGHIIGSRLLLVRMGAKVASIRDLRPADVHRLSGRSHSGPKCAGSCLCLASLARACAVLDAPQNPSDAPSLPIRIWRAARPMCESRCALGAPHRWAGAGWPWPRRFARPGWPSWLPWLLWCRYWWPQPPRSRAGRI